MKTKTVSILLMAAMALFSCLMRIFQFHRFFQ